MKRLLIAALALLTTNLASAQPWMAGHENERVKLQDIIKEYNSSAAVSAGEEDEEDAVSHNSRTPGENRNYQVDRWVWYMQQHLDADGYIVPASKTFEEWMTYQQGRSKTPSAAKTAATVSNWVFKGPSTTPGGYRGIGRVQVVAFHPTDSRSEER